MSLVLATLLEELSAGRLKVVDLTQPLSPQTALLPLPTQWNNTPAFKIWELSRYDESAAPLGIGMRSRQASTLAPILTPLSTGSRAGTFQTTPWIASRPRSSSDLPV